jgi:putative Holliday junction resolvase
VSFIGIDYGGRRIGVAVSESGVIATPHSVVENAGESEQAIARIDAIGRETAAEIYVVGVARRARSNSGEEKFQRFADRLRQKTCKEVVLWDESLSTVEATELARAAGRDARTIRKEIDMYAAAVILQSWLDARAGRQP